MKKIINWLIVIIGVAGLISIRFLEDKIFYDPFLEYFHRVNKDDIFPNFTWATLILHYIFRFLLNLFFSLIIIQFLFQKKEWTIQAGVLILLVFIVTFSIYLYCIYDEFRVGHLFSFYMRRFVIQPLITLFIIPLFYYRQKIGKK